MKKVASFVSIFVEMEICRIFLKAVMTEITIAAMDVPKTVLFKVVSAVILRIILPPQYVHK